MRYRCIDRPADSFQQPVASEMVERLCHRAFGNVRIDSVGELPWGSYNTAYRVDFDAGDPVVLRVAPTPDRQFRAEAAMMRNEYAAAPYFAPVADLLPRILFADFTHQLIGRDYLFETLLPGVPAPEAMGNHSRDRWGSLFRQLGEVARRIHEVRCSAFGPVAGPGFASWSSALTAYFRAAAADVRDAGYDPDDVLRLATTTERLSAVFDEVTEPRLLHGDGWTGNFLLDPASADLAVTGLCDWDRAEWGDPMADWAVQRALQRHPGTERDAFWVGYGQPAPAEGVRQQVYRARHLIGHRLDRIRSGRDDLIEATYTEIHAILERIATAEGMSGGARG